MLAEYTLGAGMSGQRRHAVNTRTDVDTLNAMLRIADLEQRLSVAEAERDAERFTRKSLESRLHAATQAGTPYAADRDAMNALIVENQKLEQQLTSAEADYLEVTNDAKHMDDEVMSLRTRLASAEAELAKLRKKLTAILFNLTRKLSLSKAEVEALKASWESDVEWYKSKLSMVRSLLREVCESYSKSDFDGTWYTVYLDDDWWERAKGACGE